MEDFFAGNTNQSKISQGQTGLQHSGLDVVLQSGITEERRFSMEVTILLSLLAGFFRETCSADASYLAIHAGRSIAINNGISGKAFDKIIPMVLKEAERLRKQNPLSGMF